MKKLRQFLYISLIILLLSVFFYSGYQLFSYYRESAETSADYDALSQLRQEATTIPTTRPTAPPEAAETTETVPPETETQPDPNAGLTPMTHPVTGETVWMREEFCALFEVNPDIVGWILVEDTNIDYPVTQRPSEKDYYLKRDFYGKHSSRGCIYAREECHIFSPTGVVTLYGHMMKDGTMFADLNNYMYPKYRDKNPHIRFDTLRETGLYEVICAFKTTATVGKGFAYHLYTDFQTQQELDDFWAECTARQFYDTGLTPTLGDKLLLLSTCEYTLENGRLVILARRIEDSPGE